MHHDAGHPLRFAALQEIVDGIPRGSSLDGRIGKGKVARLFGGIACPAPDAEHAAVLAERIHEVALGDSRVVAPDIVLGPPGLGIPIEQHLRPVGQKKIRREHVPGTPYRCAAEECHLLADVEHLACGTAALHGEKVRPPLDAPLFLLPLVIGNAYRESHVRVAPINGHEFTAEFLLLLGIVRAGMMAEGESGISKERQSRCNSHGFPVSRTDPF